MSEESPERRAPVSPEERAEQIRLAKERAAAARVARDGGAAPAPAAAPAASQAPAEVPAQETPAAASTSAEPPAAAAPRAERAAPLSPAERAAAIDAAKQRATAAKAARESGAAPAAAQATPAPAARPALSAEDRAAAVAQAQERAAAVRAQRTATPAAAAVAEPPEAAPAWRVGPGGVTSQIMTARPDARSQEAASVGPLQRMVLKRRDFLRGGFWSGLGVLLVSGLAQTLDLMNPRDIHGFGGVVTVAGSNVPKPGGDPYHFIEGKLWLVNLKAGEGVPKQFESVGPPSKNGGLVALYQKCVHLGCTVPWRSDFDFGGVTGWFRCPCHGSTYTKGGVRVFGPAPRSLDTFDITKVDQNGVQVNTGKITLGNTSDPQRAVAPGPFA